MSDTTVVHVDTTIEQEGTTDDVVGPTDQTETTVIGVKGTTIDATDTAVDAVITTTGATEKTARGSGVTSVAATATSDRQDSVNTTHREQDVTTSMRQTSVTLASSTAAASSSHHTNRTTTSVAVTDTSGKSVGAATTEEAKMQMDLNGIVGLQLCPTYPCGGTVQREFSWSARVYIVADVQNQSLASAVSAYEFEVGATGSIVWSSVSSSRFEVVVSADVPLEVGVVYNVSVSVVSGLWSRT